MQKSTTNSINLYYVSFIGGIFKEEQQVAALGHTEYSSGSIFFWRIEPAEKKARMSLQIRRIHQGDQALFIRIADDVFDQAINLDKLKVYLAQACNLMVVAIMDGEIVGQCAGVIFNHPDKVTELYIDELGVGRNFRRQGIARGILNEMFTWGRSAGCDAAWIGAEPDNIAAIALYDSYKGEPVEDYKMYRFNLNPESGHTPHSSRSSPRYPKPNGSYKS